MHSNKVTLLQLKLMAFLDGEGPSRGIDLTNSIDFNAGSYRILYRMQSERLLKVQIKKSGKFYSLTYKGWKMLDAIRKELSLNIHLGL